MSDRSPSFDRPPVSEVSLEVHFDRLPRVRSAHLARLWDRLGGPEQFPDTDDLFTSDVEMEKFPADADSPQVNFSFNGRPPGTRTRFYSDDRRVEIQEDALAASWYGEPCTTSYPRYEAVRSQFVDALDAWRQVTSDMDLGALNLLQAEVSYRNKLLIGHGWELVDQIPGDVLKIGKLPTAGEVPAEDFHLYQRHVLIEAEGPIGRLYVSIDSAREYHGTKSLDFSLTVRRLLPKDTPDEALIGVFDAGHDLIVHTFETATTERMHELWGRRA